MLRISSMDSEFVRPRFKEERSKHVLKIRMLWEVQVLGAVPEPCPQPESLILARAQI